MSHKSTFQSEGTAAHWGASDVSQHINVNVDNGTTVDVGATSNPPSSASGSATSNPLSSASGSATSSATSSASESLPESSPSNSAQQALSKTALTRLIRKSMRGEEAAFVKLFGLFVKEVYHLANAMLDNKNDLDDVVQETAIGLYQGITKLQSPYAFHAYLFGTVKNICIQRNKRQSCQQQDSIEETEQELYDDEKYTPEALSDEQSLSDVVRSLIHQLPQKQRLSLLLFYYYDMSYKEIAAATDVSVSAVGTNINKAKKALKKLIEDYEQRHKDNEVFHGVAIGPLITGVFANEINSLLSDAAASQLLQLSAQRIHLFSTSLTMETVGFTSKVISAILSLVSSKTAIIVLTSVAVFLTGAGVAVYQIQSADARHSAFIAARGLFEPDVEITLGEMLTSTRIVPSSTTTAPTTQIVVHYPAFAEIYVSEGFPVMWRIVEQNGATAAATGVGARINESIFVSLPLGFYTIEWTVENDAGQSGIARRDFVMY